MTRNLPPTETIFRQSLKQFVIMARNEWSPHQNSPHITNLTRTTPRIQTVRNGNLNSVIWLRIRVNGFAQEKIIVKGFGCAVFLGFLARVGFTDAAIAIVELDIGKHLW